MLNYVAACLLAWAFPSILIEYLDFCIRKRHMFNFKIYQKYYFSRQISLSLYLCWSSINRFNHFVWDQSLSYECNTIKPPVYPFPKFIQINTRNPSLATRGRDRPSSHIIQSPVTKFSFWALLANSLELVGASPDPTMPSKSSHHLSGVLRPIGCQINSRGIYGGGYKIVGDNKYEG